MKKTTHFTLTASETKQAIIAYLERNFDVLGLQEDIVERMNYSNTDGMDIEILSFDEKNLDINKIPKLI
jgi:hypothetical protein